MKNLFPKKEFEIFQHQIRGGLKTLTSDQKKLFTWKCAVRALPFLEINEGFNFWEEAQQKNLYLIFQAIDLSASKSETLAMLKVKNDLFNSVRSISATNVIRDVVDTVTKAIIINTHAQEEDTIKLVALTAAIDCLRASYSYDASIFSLFKNIILYDLHVSDQDEEAKKRSFEIYYLVWGRFLKALHKIDCSYWANWFHSIIKKELLLDKTDLAEIEMRLNIPPELSYNGASSTAKYIQQLKLGAERLNEARIIILGDKGAGKTCLARRLINPNAAMTTNDQSTPGVETSIWKLEKENLNVHIWDFAGHTVTHAVHQFFLSERCLYIIVYDGRTEGYNRWEYWLNHMKNYGKDSNAIILVNKRDDHAVGVPINKLKEQYPIIDFKTFSISDDLIDLEKFRQSIADYIVTNPSWSKQLIPESSYKVKNELETLFDNNSKKGKELISREAFDEIAQKYKVKDTEALLSDLHALGVSLWYKDMEGFNTLVLNPEWISNGVYRIINWAYNQKKYSLSIVDFKSVFENFSDRYSIEHYHYLRDLMKKYELAYESEKEHELIIPRLLPEDQPADLLQFSVGDSLMARYKADHPLMADTISRFIVRHHQEIRKHNGNSLVWRNGVILETGDQNCALIRETNDRTIEISVKGNSKTEFLSRLRETLNSIFEGYKSKKPEIQYRVQRFGEIYEDSEYQDPLWLADRKILAHTKENMPYLDETTGQKIVLDSMLKPFNIQDSIIVVGKNIHWDQSKDININFRDCNIALQGNLNDLARQLIKAGKKDIANEITEASELLAEVEDCKNPEEIKKKGILRGLQDFIEKLGDEKSTLFKTVKGVEKGIDIVQDFAKEYNKIAQWLALPQIPTVFLKEESKRAE